MNKKVEDAWEAFSDGVVAIDSQLKIVSFSKGAARITGHSAQEVIGRTWREVFAGDLCERLRPLKKSLQTDELFSNVRSEIERADGERIMISASISPLKDRRGGIVGAVMSFRDVDEVYKLTAQCYKETMRLQAILNSIADGVFTVDNNFSITSFNPAAERITGYRASEVMGKPCRLVFQSKSCAESCCLKRTVETGENISNFEMEIVNCSGERVPVSVSTALLVDEEGKIVGGVETFRDLSVLEDLRKELEERYSFSHIVGKNMKMQRIYHLIEVVSQTSSTVLVQGETGTGKDLIARAIHYNSPRRDGPFVKVSCAALPETLLESEFFGHKRGAFTGAIKDKPGRFSIANGGTIFLDEVGEIPVGVQAKLLRVLEEQEFEPLGGTNSVTVDVRIIAATNRDLEEAMREKKFREDLYYRLNVITISIPPLSDRSDDIPLLIDHFIRKYNRKMKKRISSVSQGAMDVLLDYAWPGNVRQLEHAIEHAFIHCRKDVIRRQHLPEEIMREETDRAGEPPTQPAPLREMEKQVILRLLEESAWSRKKTAHALGISRTTLWRKMKQHGISKTPS
jgi:PAS domain S-box-containing protein